MMLAVSLALQGPAAVRLASWTEIPMKSKLLLVALMASAAFFTLLGYELMRSSATVLFKNAYGAENLPLVMAAMPIVMLIGVWGYGHLLSRWGPQATLQITIWGSVVLMVLGYVGLLWGMLWVTALLFLLKEFYVVLLIEQYWSYINSKLDQGAAKKFNGPITGVAGLGSVLGAELVARLAQPLGTEQLILVSAAVLPPAAVLCYAAFARFGNPEDVESMDREEEKSFSRGVGWHFVRQNPRLIALLVIVVASQVIAAVLDFKFQFLLSESFVGRPDAETAFQGEFWRNLNATAVIAQFVLTPLLLTFIALRWVHLLMPMIQACAIVWALIDPSIWSVGLAFFLFKVFDYSLFRGAKELVYLPLDFQARYRAKEFIDVFGYRTSKGGTALVIASLQKMGYVMHQYYLWIGLCFVGLWLMMVAPLTRSTIPESANQTSTD